MRSWLRLRHRPGVRLDNLEASRGEAFHQRLWRPAPGTNNGMVERLNLGADEESDEERSARLENACELIKSAVDRVGIVVDQRVPGEHASHTARRERQLIDAALEEGDALICGASVFEERWYLIDPDHTDALRREMPRPVTRPAPSIENEAFDLTSPPGD